MLDQVEATEAALELIEEIKKVDSKIGDITVFDVYNNEDKSELSLSNK